MSQHYKGSLIFLDCCIRRSIRNCYGEKCFKCKRVIKMKFNGDPLYRRLSKADAAMSQLNHRFPTGEVDGAFHAKCWKEYKKNKSNARRREKYAERFEKYDSDKSADEPDPEHVAETNGCEPTTLAKAACIRTLQ